LRYVPVATNIEGLIQRCLEVTGNGGIRLSQRWGLAVSRNTLLRMMRRCPCSANSTLLFQADEVIR
jgi:hypothetical protein